MRVLQLVAAALCAPSLLFVSAARIQAANLTQTAEDASRAQQIRDSFRTSYNEYKKYAYPADALLPLSRAGEGGFGNWQATVVDALSTAVLMNETDLVEDMIQSIEKIDFTNTSQTTVSLFETNIRYLGGLLSAYELTGKQNTRFLEQATIVGDHLLAGWIGSQPLPNNGLRAWDLFGLPKSSPDGALIAEVGTLLMEMSTLSKYTKNTTYASYAKRAMAAVVKTTNKPFPGLAPQSVDPATARPTNDYVTWEGGSDSYFEYLIKYAYLVGNSSSIFATEFIKALNSSVYHLLVEPQGHPDLLFLSSYSESAGGTIPRFGHLGCFAGGTWILGGTILGQKDWVRYGKSLAYSCAQTYRRSVTGIGPESFVYIASGNNTNGVSIYDQAFYDKNGFNYESAAYVLRPEVSESVFYAYRSTGDPYWKELNWLAFQNIAKYCNATRSAKPGNLTTIALAGINEVNNTATIQLDTSESFLYAELYKYLYLTFADPNVAHLDKYVLTTEGHPLELYKPGAFKERKDLPPLEEQLQPAQRPKHKATVTPSKTDKVPLPKYSELPKSASGFIQHAQTLVRAFVAGKKDSTQAQTPLQVPPERMHKVRSGRSGHSSALHA